MPGTFLAPFAAAALLEEFADDCVIKPVELAVLVARVGRVLSRVREPAATVTTLVTIDDRAEVDLATGRATVDGQPVQLPSTESKLLQVLLRFAGRTVSNDFLLRSLRPLEEVSPEALRVHVHRLRRKIETDPRRPRCIRTSRGMGYRIAHDSAASRGCLIPLTS